MRLWDGEEVIDRADAKWLTPQMQRMWRAEIHLEVLVLYEPTEQHNTSNMDWGG